MNDGQSIYLPPGPRSSIGRSAEATARSPFADDTPDQIIKRLTDLIDSAAFQIERKRHRAAGENR